LKLFSQEDILRQRESHLIIFYTNCRTESVEILSTEKTKIKWSFIQHFASKNPHPEFRHAFRHFSVIIYFYPNYGANMSIKTVSFTFFCYFYDFFLFLKVTLDLFATKSSFAKVQSESSLLTSQANQNQACSQARPIRIKHALALGQSPTMKDSTKNLSGIFNMTVKIQVKMQDFGCSSQVI